MFQLVPQAPSTTRYAAQFDIGAPLSAGNEANVRWAIDPCGTRDRGFSRIAFILIAFAGPDFGIEAPIIPFEDSLGLPFFGLTAANTHRAP
ncbi:MAG: hypothetical protein AAGA48_25040 [Myxococcota bacterium]